MSYRRQGAEDSPGKTEAGGEQGTGGQVCRHGGQEDRYAGMEEG